MAKHETFEGSDQPAGNGSSFFADGVKGFSPPVSEVVSSSTVLPRSEPAVPVINLTVSHGDDIYPAGYDGANTLLMQGGGSVTSSDVGKTTTSTAEMQIDGHLPPRANIEDEISGTSQKISASDTEKGRIVDHGSTGERVPVDANTRACNTVLHSIGTFPQAGDGAVLIAKRTLEQLQGDPYQPSIQELVEIDPDGKYLAKKANAFHDKFDIPYRVDSTRATQLVTTFAINAVDFVRTMTVNAADMTQTGIPDELRYPIRDEGMEVSVTDSSSINHERSQLLEETLRSNPELLRVVYYTVSVRAADIKARSRAQRQAQQKRGQVFQPRKKEES